MNPPDPTPACLDRLIDWRRIAGIESTASWATRKRALCAHFRSRRTPRHHFDLCDRDGAVTWLRELHPRAEAAFLAEADPICRAPREDPNWTHGRHYWLRPLTRAFLLTKNPVYVEAGLENLRLWTRTAQDYKDPYQRSLRFRGLTNARRTLVLIYFFAATRDAAPWTDANMEWFLALLHETVAATESHERLPWHNIYFSTLVARHVFSLCFPEFKVSARWGPETLAGIEECASLHMRPDGSNIEQSPNYHRVVMNGLATVALVRKINDLPVPGRILSNIQRMAEFLMGVQTPDEGVPPLGDTAPTHDMREMLFLPSLFREDGRYRRARPSAEQCFYLPNAESRACLARPETPPLPKDAAFPDAGYYVMRSSWDRDAIYMTFDAGPHGYYHGHEDLFSIHLMAGDRALVPDPGSSYAGSPAARGIRLTAFHNTINLDGFSHRIFEDETDRLAHVTQWETRSDGAVLLTARHTAYDHLWGRPVVTRQIFFDGRNLFAIVDRVVCAEVGRGRRPHALASTFTLPDKEHIQCRADLGWVRTTFPDGPNLFLQCINRNRIHAVELGPALLAHKGLVETSRFTAVDNGDRTWLAFVLRIADGEATEALARAEGTADGTIAIEVETADGPLDLAFGPSSLRARKAAR